MIKFKNITIEKCPKCQSENLDMVNSQISPSGFKVSIRCQDCGHTEKLEG